MSHRNRRGSKNSIPANILSNAHPSLPCLHFPKRPRSRGVVRPGLHSHNRDSVGICTAAFRRQRETEANNKRPSQPSVQLALLRNNIFVPTLFQFDCGGAGAKGCRKKAESKDKGHPPCIGRLRSRPRAAYPGAWWATKGKINRVPQARPLYLVEKQSA